MLAKTFFSFALGSGDYECKVRAINGSSNTEYAYSKFSVDSGLDISKKKVALKLPADKTISNKLTQKFEWYALANAERYLLEILLDGTVIRTESVTTGLSKEITFSEAGDYQWRILAMGAASPSLYSAFFNIKIDKDGPLVSVPTSPLNVDTASNPVSLKWNRDASAIGDSVFISADDSLFKSTVKAYVTATPAAYTYNTGVIGKTYYWRLRSVDGAGNSSVGYSPFGKFKIIK